MKSVFIRSCICLGLIASAAASAGGELDLAAAVQPEAESAQALSEADLDLLHAGQSVVTANQTLTATTSDNVLTGDYVAGNVTLTDEALSNFDGFGNFAINTGAQVSIQSAMNVTINVGE